MKYHAQKLTKTYKSSPYKLDQESDRFRICKNCGRKFMATDRRRIHCDDDCSDEFHGARKRLKRDANKLNAEIEKQQQLEVSEELIEETNKDTIKETNEETDESILQSNLSILESLQISKKGDYYNLDFLHSYGFQFSHYSGKGLIFNTDPNLNCHFTQVGNYRLYRVAFSTILIINLIHIPC